MIMRVVRQHFEGKPFDFFDVGCNNGRMLLLSIACGAQNARGVELAGGDVVSRRGEPSEGGLSFFFRSRVSTLGLEDRVFAQFGEDASSMHSYHVREPSLPAALPICLYMFLEGMVEADLAKCYLVASRSPGVSLIATVPHKGKGNCLRAPGEILKVLGAGWRLKESIDARQVGSSNVKVFFLFERS
jgi:hypothetical protein